MSKVMNDEFNQFKNLLKRNQHSEDPTLNDGCKITLDNDIIYYINSRLLEVEKTIMTGQSSLSVNIASLQGSLNAQNARLDNIIDRFDNPNSGIFSSLTSAKSTLTEENRLLDKKIQALPTRDDLEISHLKTVKWTLCTVIGVCGIWVPTAIGLIIHFFSKP